MPKKQAKPISKKVTVKKDPIKESVVAKQVRAIRPNTKIAKLVEMLNSEDGSTIARLTELLNWQPHTVRGALSRLNKLYGIEITNGKSADDKRTYKLLKRGM